MGRGDWEEDFRLQLSCKELLRARSTGPASGSSRNHPLPQSSIAGLAMHRSIFFKRALIAFKWPASARPLCSDSFAAGLACSSAFWCGAAGMRRQEKRRGTPCVLGLA